jgi:hypothetical protein
MQTRNPSLGKEIDREALKKMSRDERLHLLMGAYFDSLSGHAPRIMDRRRAKLAEGGQACGLPCSPTT